MNQKSVFIILCAFLMGALVGIFSDSYWNINKNNIVSRTALEDNIPSKNTCLAYGASALVIDNRNFITFNPFRIYTAQASVQPGCVLGSDNWIILENKNLIDNKDIKNCKKNMNSFGFTGKLDQSPNISCVYESDSQQNHFFKDFR
uniref:DUF3172-containing protein n=1 Tax=Gronococcus sybilensis TaxID=3028029 RepID=A0A9Y1MX23_9RHOD|nr:DUF3172-containing protein [Gronococcus sybilensis]